MFPVTCLDIAKCSLLLFKKKIYLKRISITFYGMSRMLPHQSWPGFESCPSSPTKQADFGTFQQANPRYGWSKCAPLFISPRFSGVDKKILVRTTLGRLPCISWHSWKNKKYSRSHKLALSVSDVRLLLIIYYSYSRYSVAFRLSLRVSRAYTQADACICLLLGRRVHEGRGVIAQRMNFFCQTPFIHRSKITDKVFQGSIGLGTFYRAKVPLPLGRQPFHPSAFWMHLVDYLVLSLAIYFNWNTVKHDIWHTVMINNAWLFGLVYDWLWPTLSQFHC